MGFDRAPYDRLLALGGPREGADALEPLPGSPGDPDELVNWAADEIVLLRTALGGIFDSYKALADSGDCGFWSLEELPEGKAALAALKRQD